MSFECGLRRKQRELGVAIQQRDRIIREQAIVIRFLAEKTGNKTRKISDLKNEAMAKIPQIVNETEQEEESSKKASGSNPLHLTTIRVTGGAGATGTGTNFPGTELTSILETGSENGDSDSAIILDDSLASTLSSNSSNTGASSDHLSSTSSSSDTRRCHLRRISRSVSDVMSVCLMSEGSGQSSGNNLNEDQDDDLEEETNHSSGDKSSP